MGIKEKVNKLPDTPGVYIMKSAQGQVLYVGKATALRKRVGSYFSASRSPRADTFREAIADIDYIECETPEQALILEAALIKERRPKYNISLRDDKSYPYIAVSEEKFPRIFISRPKARPASLERSILFGPYPKAKPLKAALTMIRKVFTYRSCKVMPKKACLYYHLNLCPAPCINKITVPQYREHIRDICRILSGKRKELAKFLRKKMARLSGAKKFEAAARLRDKLLAIDSLYKGRPKAHEIISLQESLNLKRLPLTIEAIDISSLGKQEAVGSVVVFRDGSPDKSSYRRFKIRRTGVIDDYAMIAEVIRRRYTRLIKEKTRLPDLIVVDGGKGHVMRAAAELRSLGISAAVVGIAKKNEEIWFPHKGCPLCIPGDKPGLHLIQRIRDEAHRFAHSYQLIRRRKRMEESRKPKITKQ